MKIKLTSLLGVLVFATSIVAVPMRPIRYNWVTDRNKREYQEDRFTYASIKNAAHRKIGTFFAVYDGHGGDKTSIFLQKNLHIYFSHCLRSTKNEKNAFECAFLKAETKALQSFDDGSTAVVGYIDNKNNLHCAWVGDSRLVVEKNGKVGFATKDHKPDRPDEKKRIQNAGGNVVVFGVPRVNGLAVSRSIGDKFCKQGAQGQIIAIPEYARYHLTRNNNFFIVASDGLWDVVTNEEAVDLVKKAFQQRRSCKAAAGILKKEAIKRQSADNITIAVVKLR